MYRQYVAFQAIPPADSHLSGRPNVSQKRLDQGGNRVA